ncbi:MAG TPA: SLC13 family permease [Blastocatellia bacterium]|nr:SLC13 family permease [Blastocatellia bacterium]
MLIQLTAIAIFIAIFAIATLRKVHLGITMFAAACGVGVWLAKMPLKDVVGGFPISIMVLLVGVTYFFAIAQVNGTIDRVIDAVLGRVGDNAVLLPFLFFALTAGISAMGSPLAGLVMAPVGMPIAKKYGMDPMLMALAIGCGFSAGAFAPTSLFGIVSYGTAHQANIDLSPLTLFAVAGVTNICLLTAAFFIFGGPKLIRRGVAPSAPIASPTQPFGDGAADQIGKRSIERDTPSGSTAATALARQPRGEESGTKFGRNQIATIICMIGLASAVIAVSVAGLNPDVGVLCFAFGAALALIDPASGKAAVSKIDWPTVLLVGGIITYVGVLQSMGTVELLGQAAKQIGAPIVTALVICIIAGLVSAFASTTGILAALVPLALPLVASGDVAGWALISALAVCASIVDVSPFSTVGATLIATAAEDERPRMTSLLTRWGFSMVIIGPLILVAILVLPSTL